jgi:hypothetical protein
MKTIFKSIILITGLAVAAPQVHAQVSVGLSVRIGPPAIPVYEQPICPSDGYIWTPGYWAYGDGGYYWVPGVWVAPPSVGVLWTPAWWGYSGGIYAFHSGYWGPHVGFYGGINYGYGYGGSGYYGGRWNGGRFAYNTSVTRVNRTIIHNTYINNNYVRNSSRVSYNGGHGGVTARPSRADQMAARDRHISPTSNQMAHQHSASADRRQFASVNHGRPATTAVARDNGHNAAVKSANNRAAANNHHATTRQNTANRTANVNHHANTGAQKTVAHNNTRSPQHNATKPNESRQANVQHRSAPQHSSMTRQASTQRAAPQHSSMNLQASAPRSAPQHSNNQRMSMQQPQRQPSHASAPRPASQPHSQPQQHSQGSRPAPSEHHR